jgi:hypothetical protein
LREGLSKTFAEGLALGLGHALRRIDCFTVGLACLFLACDPEAPPPLGGDADTRVGDTGGLDAGDTLAPDGPAPVRFGTTATDLFAPRNLPRFELSLPPERWASMQAHARDEQWETATLRYQGALVGLIQVRFKGGFGTLVTCTSDSGRIVCPKLSMKLKFSGVDEDRRFFGLKRLNLHAMARDPSLIRERLAYAVLAGVGIAAPRAGHATLSINGEDLGLYAMVEEIDGRFTDERWSGAGDGPLFKGAWPLTEDPSYYTERLATHEDDGDVRTYVAVAKDLRSVMGDPVRLRETAGRYFDLDALARTLAALDAIGAWDNVVNFICGDDLLRPGLCVNANYFVYQDEKRPTFTVIPWDMDQSFIARGGFAFAPHWTLPVEGCPARFTFAEGREVSLAGCDPLMAAVRADPTRYREAMGEILSGPLARGELERQIDWFESFLADAVVQDKTVRGLTSWRTQLADLRRQVGLLRARAEVLRDGRPFRVLAIDPLGDTTFDADDDLAAALGVVFQSSAGTSIDASMVIEEAEVTDAEDRALAFAFDFRNPPSGTPYGSWALGRLEFQSGAVSLTERTALRVTVTSDSARTVRIELSGAVYLGASDRPGWDVPLTVGTHELTLPLWGATYAPDAQLAPALGTVLYDASGLVILPRARFDLSGHVSEDGDRGQITVDDIRFE